MTDLSDKQPTAAQAGFPAEATDATLRASRALLGVVARSVADALDIVHFPNSESLRCSRDQARSGWALAARVGAVPSTFSRTIDRMADSGWVQRNKFPKAGREVLIDLTAHGQQLVSHGTERRRRLMEANPRPRCLIKSAPSLPPWNALRRRRRADSRGPPHARTVSTTITARQM